MKEGKQILGQIQLTNWREQKGARPQKLESHRKWFSYIGVNLRNRYETTIRRRRQLNENVTKLPLRVLYTFWYISPFFAQPQLEMAKFRILKRALTRQGEFSFLYLNLNAVPSYEIDFSSSSSDRPHWTDKRLN